MPILTRPDAPALGWSDTGGDGPAVVFSHGILMDRSMFDPQVAALAPAYRCLAWDQRGHGETGLVDEPFSYWDSAQDLLALLDAAAVERAVLVGMSQGGFVSLRAALLAPERVRGLVFIDSQAGVESEEAGPLYHAMAENWAREGANPDVSAFVAGLILGPDADHAPWIAKWAAQPKEQVLAPVATLLAREDLHGRLAEVTAPALVIHGTADAAVPMELGEALCAGLPGCRGVVPIEGAGHASNVSHPTEVTAALRDFLDALPA